MAELFQPDDAAKLAEVVRLMQQAKRWDLADAVSRAIPARAPDSCRKCGAKRGESCRSDWTTCEGAAHLSGVPEVPHG